MAYPQIGETLNRQCTDLRNHLDHFGVPVLSAEVYPQGGKNFAKAFRADLVQVDRFV